MQNTSLPRSTSRQSLASNNGLRARDLHRLQAQLDEHEYDIQRHQEQERSSHERSYASKRRTSVTSANASHYSYTSRPSLQPADRQHSSGYLRERQERPAPASRSRRTASNASKSSTILSAGLRDHSWQDGAATRDAHPAIKLRASSSYIKLDDLQTHSSPLRRWCRLVEKSCRGSGTPQSAKEWAVAVACIVWIKWAVGIGGWSGKQRAIRLITSYKDAHPAFLLSQEKATLLYTGIWKRSVTGCLSRTTSLYRDGIGTDRNFGAWITLLSPPTTRVYWAG
jgi:hypothetical protein